MATKIVNFNGQDFLVNEMYAMESIAIQGAKLMNVRPLIYNGESGRRVGIAIDFVREGECSKDSIETWPTYSLDEKEEAALLDAIRHGEVTELLLHQSCVVKKDGSFVTLDRDGNEVAVRKDSEGHLILPFKWVNWRHADTGDAYGWRLNHKSTADRLGYTGKSNANDNAKSDEQ